jgi:hypothetical protein
MAATIFVLDVLVTLGLAGALLFRYGNWVSEALGTLLFNSSIRRLKDGFFYFRCAKGWPSR